MKMINTPVAVIGAGTMGAGIAQVAAAAGHPVTVIDADQGALARCRVGIDKSLAEQILRGRLDASVAAAIAARINWSSHLGEASRALLAIEAIVERLDAKLELFERLVGLLPAEAILTTNTSSLSIGALAHVAPGRLAGLHFFNPVPAMKLVEVIPALDTDPAIVERLSALMRAWGKQPVIVRDVPGFIVNRVARPYYGEGFIALGEGIDAACIDRALAGAGGFRMGPLALADLIGQDINYSVAQSIFDAYRGKTRFYPHPRQQALVERGALGRKTGSGIYDYAAPLPESALLTSGTPPRTFAIGANSPQLDLLGKALRTQGAAVAEDPDLPPESMRADDVRFALGDGRSLGRRDDADVLIDHARDLFATPLLVVTARDAGSAATAAAVAAAMGKQALSFPDRPGQIVLRTLSQLANAAVDALADDVASASGIDDALRHGANHPEGPLHWARRLGPAIVGGALDHIARETGDSRYTPAPGLSGLDHG
jgi:3-hydroxybutyryl-CoA dehydrogenase